MKITLAFKFGTRFAIMLLEIMQTDDKMVVRSWNLHRRTYT